MKTKYKIFFAKILYNFISLFIKKKDFICQRKGLNWVIDLSEAIDLHIFIFGQFEIEIKNAARKLRLNKHKKILDIGANFGVQSLQFAKEFNESKIYSIEPTDYAFLKMKKNFDINNELSKNLHPFQLFLGSDNQNLPISIHSSWNLKDNIKKHAKHFGVIKNTSNASIMTLDQFVENNNIDNLDFIKLDVDGYELDVLRGGENFLKKNKPPIFMELAPYLYEEFGYKNEKLINFLISFDYKFYDLNKIELIKDISFFSKNIKDGSSKNILVI